MSNFTLYFKMKTTFIIITTDFRCVIFAIIIFLIIPSITVFTIMISVVFAIIVTLLLFQLFSRNDQCIVTNHHLLQTTGEEQPIIAIFIFVFWNTEFRAFWRERLPHLAYCSLYISRKLYKKTLYLEIIIVILSLP